MLSLYTKEETFDMPRPNWKYIDKRQLWNHGVFKYRYLYDEIQFPEKVGLYTENKRYNKT